jgi:hypothetical protein
MQNRIYVESNMKTRVHRKRFFVKTLTTMTVALLILASLGIRTQIVINLLHVLSIQCL